MKTKFLSLSIMLLCIFAINFVKAQTFLYQFSVPSNPLGVAIDGCNNIYVGNSTNTGIEKYTSSGGLITTLNVPTGGTPQDMSIDNSGNLWVADYSGKVLEYTNGVLKNTITAAFYTNFFCTRGVFAASNGNLYVADACNFRIVVINSSNGIPISQIGTTGTQGKGNYIFGYPTDVTVDALGFIYVVDQSNNRIVKYNSAGTYQTEWGAGTLNQPWSITLDNSGNLYVTNSGSNTIIQYSTSGTILNTFGGSGTGNGKFSYPPGIVVDKSTGNILVTDNGNKLVQVFGTPCTGRIYNSAITWNGSSNGGGLMAIDNCGNIYYPALTDNKVYKYDKNGSLLLTIATASSPQGVAVDANGNIFVTSGNRVEEFNSSGSHIGGWGGSGIFNSPRGIAIDNLGYVYVVDQLNNNVQKFTNSGTLTTSWGGYGSGSGTFYQPQGITIDNAQNVYVVDLGNRLIQKFTNTGGFLTQWGSNGNLNGQFNIPNGVAADKSGNIYVTDTYNYRVQKFTNTGGYLTQFPTTGTGAGGPLGVVVDGNCNVYVGHNQFIEKFAISYNSRIAAEDEAIYESTTATSNTPIQVSPNPTSGSFQITFAEEGTHDIVIYNSRGQEVKRVLINGNAFFIDDQALQGGLYIVQDNFNGKVNKAKLLIQK